MKRALAILAVSLSACTPPPKREPQAQEVEKGLMIVMAVGVQDTTQLKVGQCATYSARKAGDTGAWSTRLAVVDAKDSTFWIENRTIMPSGQGHQLNTVISKYQIAPDAKTIQWWMAEPGQKPIKVYPGKDARGNDITLPQPQDDSKTDVEIAEETITVASTGKKYDCTRLTSKVKYAAGSETTLTTWCSKDVPFWVVYRGKAYGGVVRRTYGTYTLELDSKGTDAVPMLTLPEK